MVFFVAMAGEVDLLGMVGVVVSITSMSSIPFICPATRNPSMRLIWWGLQLQRATKWCKHMNCEMSVWFFRKLKKMYSISKYFSCWEGLGYIKVVLHCTLQSWKVGCYAYCHQFASYSITLYLMLMDALKLDPILRGDLGSFSDIHGLFSSSRTDGATYVNPCNRYHICHQSIDGK